MEHTLNVIVSGQSSGLNLRLPIHGPFLSSRHANFPVTEAMPFFGRNCSESLLSDLAWEGLEMCGAVHILHLAYKNDAFLAVAAQRLGVCRPVHHTLAGGPDPSPTLRSPPPQVQQGSGR